MSNSANKENDALSMREIVTLIIKTRKIHEGFFVPAIEFNFGAGMDGPSEEEVVPTMRIGIRSINISKVEESTPFSVDASVVNPKSSARAKKTKPE